MVIGVVGLWHLGETVALGLSALGHRVIGIDENAETVQKFVGGVLPLQEPGLEELLKKSLASGALSLASDFSRLGECEAVFITFDTPIANDDTPDTTVIFDAAKRWLRTSNKMRSLW